MLRWDGEPGEFKQNSSFSLARRPSVFLRTCRGVKQLPVGAHWSRAFTPSAPLTCTLSGSFMYDGSFWRKRLDSIESLWIRVQGDGQNQVCGV